ncbi:MAG: helix-turn-helix transcriptional regulator [Roseburia sp.]|nr:helix-turn-helix transcriptional regulator [Roseburia sp.]
MKSIGTRIRTSRKNKKLTQEQLEEVLSVSPQTVSKWENSISGNSLLIFMKSALLIFFSIPAIFVVHIRSHL